MNTLLQVKNIVAGIGSKNIINGIDLAIKRGELHVIMGPNGSGKSTFANILMGNPKFHIKKGKIIFLKKDIARMKAEERAGMGLFLTFQHPREIQGVELNRLLYLAFTNFQKKKNPKQKPMSIFEFQEKIKGEAKKLKMNPELAGRGMNEGYSGGEKKKSEMLQMAILGPTLAILDEPDSGLDIDALKIVAQAIKRFQTKEKGVLLITHYQRILKYLKPDYIHIMVDGKIVKSGGVGLAKKLEREGYEQFKF